MSEETKEEAIGSVQISSVLATFLQQMAIPIDLAQHASCFQVVPFEEDDGTKNFAIALGFTTGNGLEIIWFREQDIRVFIQNAMLAHQAMLGEINKAHPLTVATKEQMMATIQNKQMIDGKLILGGK